MANITVSVTDANNITVQLTPVAAQTITIDRGVAGNGISSIVPVTISTLQYLRIYYTNGTQADVGPLTSTAYFGETPITIVGNTISLSTVPINKGGTNAITAAAAIQNLLPSYTGNGSKRLGLNSGATALEWVLDGGGTVTSVDVSGGTTGLTTSGGPITSSGTITLAGTLAVANGGTNGTATPTAGAVPYGTGTAYAFTAAGTSGQILQSNGASAPTWANLSSLGVSSFSAGSTGFTPSTATSGAVTLAGTLATTNGGTGLTSFTNGGIVYASSTSALATGSALTFDGSTLTNTGVGYSVNNANALLRFGNAAATRTGYLQVRSDAFEIWSDQSAVPMVFGTSNAEQMRLTSTGLGIGTSSPGVKLDVAGAIRSTAATPILYLNNGTTQHSIANSSGAMPFTIDGTESMRLTSTGLKTRTTISVGDATPSTSGAGITFPATQSASTNANTLDDYEEGTWTPVAIGTTTAGTGTYTTQSGSYTKVGRLVTIICEIAWSAHTGTGYVVIGGLPFLNAGLLSVGAVYASNMNFGTLATQLTAFAINSDNNILFRGMINNAGRADTPIDSSIDNLSITLSYQSA